MTPQDMHTLGKYAALVEYGIVKDAAFLPHLKALGQRAGGLVSKVRNLFRKAPATPAAGAPTTSPLPMQPQAPTSTGTLISNKGAMPKMVEPDKMIGQGEVRPSQPSSESAALRKQMEEGTLKAPESAPGKGIPWWGKALGAGAVGYGGYQVLKPNEQPPQNSMRPYYGP